jgi:hypothetical protein
MTARGISADGASRCSVYFTPDKQPSASAVSTSVRRDERALAETDEYSRALAEPVLLAPPRLIATRWP